MVPDENGNHAKVIYHFQGPETMAQENDTMHTRVDLMDMIVLEHVAC